MLLRRVLRRRLVRVSIDTEVLRRRVSAGNLGGGQFFFMAEIPTKLLTVGVFLHTVGFFAYSLLRCLLDALSHCKQETGTVSKKQKLKVKKLQM